jgi:hypothetical protein
MTEGQIIQDFSRQVIMDSTVDLSNVPGFCDLCRVYGSVATIKKSIKKISIKKSRKIIVPGNRTPRPRHLQGAIKHIFQHPPLIEACRCQSRDKGELPCPFTPSSVASYHPPSIEVCSNHIYHSNLRGC